MRWSRAPLVLLRRRGRRGAPLVRRRIAALIALSAWERILRRACWRAVSRRILDCSLCRRRGCPIGCAAAARRRSRLRAGRRVCSGRCTCLALARRIPTAEFRRERQQLLLLERLRLRSLLSSRLIGSFRVCCGCWAVTGGRGLVGCAKGIRLGFEINFRWCTLFRGT